MEKKIWKQERPSFCPIHSCKFIFRVMDSMCGGKLPKPEPHHDDLNTHRFCMFVEEDGMPASSFQINANDSLWIREMFDEMFTK